MAPIGPLTLTYGLLVLSGFIPLILLAALPANHGGAWPEAAAIAAVAGLRYAYIAASGQRRLYEIMFWLFVYVFLGLAAMVQIRSGDYPATTSGLMVELNGRTLWVVTVGLVAAILGMVLARTSRSALQGATEELRPLREGRVRVIAVMSLLLSAYYVQAVGISTLLSNRQALDDRRAALWPQLSTRAIITDLGTLLTLVSFIALLRLRRERKAQGRKLGFMLPLLVGLTLALVINPLSSPRFVFGTAFLAVITSLGAFQTPKRVRVAALLLVAMIVLVFPYADIARFNNGTNSLSKGGTIAVLKTGDYDAFGQLNNTVNYVDQHGPTYGRQALGVAFFWVPRSIWSSKPVDTGVLLAKDRGYTFSNLSAPLWAELFINGAWPGLLIGMFGFGFLIRRLDDRSQARAEVRQPLGLLAGILPFYMLIVLRGSLLQATANLAVITVAGLFVGQSERAPVLKRVLAPRKRRRPPVGRIPDRVLQQVPSADGSARV